MNDRAYIPPTVSRMVWFFPGSNDVLKKFNDQPLSGQIAHVNADGTVNLGVLDAEGNHHARRKVRLVQADEAIENTASYCTWMPYQVGQAKRAAEEYPAGTLRNPHTGDLQGSDAQTTDTAANSRA